MSAGRGKKTQQRPKQELPPPVDDKEDKHEDVNELAEEFDSRLTLNNIDPNKRYFVYFIHELGRRGDNMPVKVGAVNDVGEYRKELEKGRENGLKTYIAIKCVKGDAEDVAKQFADKHDKSHLKNGWYTGGKTMIDAFVADVEKNGYEKATEGRARIMKSARKPSAKK